MKRQCLTIEHVTQIVVYLASGCFYSTREASELSVLYNKSFNQNKHF